MSTLEIRDLVASVAGNTILNGINLTVSSGEVHAVMGPNGAGKSTLSAVVMGKPGYEVISGSVLLDGVDLLALPSWQRAQAGLHLVMQYPTEVPGVQLVDVMDQAFVARGMGTSGLGARLGAKRRASASTPHSWSEPSTSTSRVARRSATRRCRWRCWSRRS